MLFPGLGVPVGLVTADVATGLAVVQVRSLVQLLPPEAMVQEVVGPGVRVPDIDPPAVHADPFQAVPPAQLVVTVD